MKVTMTNAERESFTPQIVTLRVETALELEVLKRLSTCNRSVPDLLYPHFIGSPSYWALSSILTALKRALHKMPDMPTFQERNVNSYQEPSL